MPEIERFNQKLHAINENIIIENIFTLVLIYKIPKPNGGEDSCCCYCYYLPWFFILEYVVYWICDELGTPAVLNHFGLTRN